MNLVDDDDFGAGGQCLLPQLTWPKLRRELLAEVLGLENRTDSISDSSPGIGFESGQPSSAAGDVARQVPEPGESPSRADHFPWAPAGRAA